MVAALLWLPAVPEHAGSLTPAEGARREFAERQFVVGVDPRQLRVDCAVAPGPGRVCTPDSTSWRTSPS